MERAGAGKGKGCEAAHQPSPGEVLLDEFLGKQGLYRKKIAKDGSCLFRAVAEQVFHTQSKHLDVRGECVSYLRRNRELFEAFIEGSFDEHLNKLEKPQEWVGQVEISALSLMYKRDFIIYQEPNRPPARVTENGFSDTISLCFSNGNHYDSVYPRKFVDAAALCQSILYETLYQNVFKADVEAVKSALDTNSKVNNAHLSCSEDSDSDAEMEKPRGKADDESDVNGSKSQSCNKVRKKQEKKNESAVLLSFPGEVLRALNPNIYRNIEYEVWQKSKQAQQKRDYSIAAGMQYVVGDKCKVCLDDGKCYNAHIQAVSPDNGPVDVYIEELGEKHSALLQNLRPLTQVSQRGTWSKVQGKRAKKPMNVNSEADFTGVKNSSSFINKPNRLQSNLPPRRHQAMAARQQSSPLQTTDHQSKVASPKYVERAEDFPQLSNIQCTAIGSSGKIELGMNEPQTSTNIQLKIDKSQSAFDNPLEKTSQIGTEQIDPVLELDLQMPHSSSSGSSVTSPVIPIYLSSQTVENSSQISSTSPSSATVSDAPMTSVWIKPPYAPFPGANFPPLLAPFIPSIYDVLYPGFPLNERGEFPTSAPLYSYDKSGADLPDDKSILRFFYNLGVQAYSFQWWPPYSYLYPLNQAYWKHCGMYPGCPPIFYANPQFQTMAGNVQNDIDGAPLHTPHPPRINTTNQSDVGDEDNLPLSAQAAAKHLSHKNKSVPVSPNPVQPPQNFNSLSPSRLPHLASDGTPQPHSGWEAPPPKSSITQNVLARPLNSHPMDMTVPGHVYPLQINDGTCVRPVDQKIGVNSGREAPPPKSSITQNVLARPLNSHPMDMTVPGHVYPLQINDGTCVRPVDQKIGVNSGREAPPPKSSITQNVLARPLNSHPMDMTVPGHVYPLQINDGTCVRPVDQKIGVNSGREAPPPKSSITQNVLARPLNSHPMDMTVPGHVYPLQINDGTCVRPVDQKIGVNSGREAPPPKSSITQNVLARPLNSHPMDMTVPGHVYPLQINDGTCVRPVDQKIGVNSGREAPPPKSSITQNVLARPLNSHPMDMTVPGHVYPLQINDGTCVRPVDQKIGVNSGREAPPPKSSITQNVLARPLNSHPMDMTVPGHVYPLQINDGTRVRPVDQKIGVPGQYAEISDNAKSPIVENLDRQQLQYNRAGEGTFSMVHSALCRELPLISKSVDAIRNSCSSDVKQQSVQSPCEECAKQHSILKKEMKPEKANLISAAGLSSLDTKNNGPQNIAEEHASNSEIDCACSEGNFKSGLASQSIGESKVDIVEQSTAVSSKNKDLMNNYKMPSTKPAHSYKQTSREMSYHVKNGPSERNVLRCSPYIHKKGERQVSRKNKQGNPWSSRNTSCLHDSNIDRTGETVTKGNNKPLIKNRIVRRSEMHIGFGGHENLQIRVENERHHMNENTLHEEPCFVNRSDDMQQFQVMENTSGAPFEGKRNSFRKQRYTSNEKSNTYARK
ncbi:OTU domain-containing protein 4 isoform X2 [Narcine bancroftii]|uniref:OTU domain-containing protein 4 isoform X2 n=1 Tax=Narcine bancroftii TaxID=1343680 RepID=UPI00383176A5